MRVVLTGGFGFLGGYVAESLAARPGLSVRVTDVRPDLPPTRVPGAEYLGGVDILSSARLDEAFRGADVVLHLAGLVSFRRRDREKLLIANRDGTRQVAEACARARVRLVHVSSVAAIGYADDPVAEATEDFDFDWAIARAKDYMVSKKASEDEAFRVADRIPVVVANPGYLYGPGEVSSAGLCRALQSGRLWAVPPGGTNVVDVRDVAECLARLCARDVPALHGKRVIAGGFNVSFLQVAREMAGILGIEASPRVLPRWTRRPVVALTEILERFRGGPVTADLVDSSYLYRYFSSARAELHLGWRAAIPLSRMLHDTARAHVAAGRIADFPARLVPDEARQVRAA